VLVPTHYNDAELLDTLGLAPSPTGDDFERQVYTLDRKLLCGDDVRFGHTNPHVSEAFVRALEGAMLFGCGREARLELSCHGLDQSAGATVLGLLLHSGLPLNLHSAGSFLVLHPERAA
jgi:hypothetical protein